MRAFNGVVVVVLKDGNHGERRGFLRFFFTCHGEGTQTVGSLLLWFLLEGGPWIQAGSGSGLVLGPETSRVCVCV